MIRPLLCQDKMSGITKAYEVLSDAKKRLNFDENRQNVR
jgi:DnaJ-class molecular chaperone